MSDDADHSDHCWLNVRGEAWAIYHIERLASGKTVFSLWRGYYPLLECKILVTGPDYPWADYCAAAVDYLAAHKPLDQFITHRHRDIRA